MRRSAAGEAPGVTVARALEVREVAGLAALRAEWSRLCDESPGTTPFQRPEWLLPWADAFPRASPRHLAVRAAGRLVGLVPLFLYRRSEDGARTLAFLGAGASDYLDGVVAPGREEEVGAAVMAHLAGDPGWDLCDWEQLPAGSPLLAWPAPAGCRDEIREGDPCPLLPLPPRVSELAESVPTRQLANLRKYRRRAAAIGELALETADGEGLAGALSTLLDLHRVRWSVRPGASPEGQLADPAMPGFLAAVAAGFAARGALALHLLRLRGRPIAGLLAFRERGTLCCYLQGSDPAYEALSPGVLLLGAVIERAVAEGLAAVDLLRGCEPYKLWWGARPRATYRRRLSRAP